MATVLIVIAVLVSVGESAKNLVKNQILAAPPATTACTQCGLNIWVLGIGLVVIATAAAIIVGSNNGRDPQHTASK